MRYKAIYVGPGVLLALLATLGALMTHAQMQPVEFIKECQLNSPVTSVSYFDANPQATTPEMTLPPSAVDVVLAITGIPMEWIKPPAEETDVFQAQYGFQWPETITHGSHWFILDLASGERRYVLFYVGASGTYYALATDSVQSYVAEYGGADTWHAHCGGWQVSSRELVHSVLTDMLIS